MGDLRGAQREPFNDSAMYVMATRRAVGKPGNMGRGLRRLLDLDTETATQRSNHGVMQMGNSPFLGPICWY